MNSAKSDFKNSANRYPASLEQLYQQTGIEKDTSDQGMLDNMNSTPIGRLLKLISSLPEVRREKVVNLRQQLHYGEYNLGDNLDTALDRVIEELITDA